MMKRVGRVMAAVAGVAVLAAQASEVKMAQDVTLRTGWNAVYVSVTPDEGADETFADWPVESVGKYNPAAFLATKQYSGEGSTEGTVASGFAMWVRGDPALSQFDRVVGNCIYVCRATNTWSGTLYGSPVAPRTTWHATSSTTPYNYVGISTVLGATTTLGDYFDGLDAGNTNFQQIYSVCGFQEGKVSLGTVSLGAPMANGFVSVMSASKPSDWSGVLNVTPQDAVDFSTNLTEVALAVRNDGAKSRRMRLLLTAGDVKPGDTPPPVPQGLLLRDTSVHTNDWQTFGRDVPFERTLASGEEVSLLLALDRTKLPEGRYGGLLHFLDVDGGSNFRATIPVSATGTGADGVIGAWPMGIWIASARFDRVTSYDAANEGRDVASGGKAEVRLPMYIDEKGAMTLLSRFVFGSDTNGVTHVYSGRTERAFPVAIGSVKRVSSSVLPVDQPTIGQRSGAFGAQAEFGFVVGEKSPVNPMRHAFHPSHDGKRWDFTTEAPSGDDLNNYVSTVKPESFSITNRLVFTWDKTTGRAWSPEETVSGELLWELTGVRKEGPVRMVGAFGMKRISNAVLDK